MHALEACALTAKEREDWVREITPKIAKGWRPILVLWRYFACLADHFFLLTPDQLTNELRAQSLESSLVFLTDLGDIVALLDYSVYFTAR